MISLIKRVLWIFTVVAALWVGYWMAGGSVEALAAFPAGFRDAGAALTDLSAAQAYLRHRLPAVIGWVRAALPGFGPDLTRVLQTLEEQGWLQGLVSLGPVGSLGWLLRWFYPGC